MRDTALTLFLAKQPDNGFAICPKPRALLHRLSKRALEAQWALIKCHCVCAFSFGHFPKTCLCPAASCHGVFKAEKSAFIVLFQTTVDRLIDHCLGIAPASCNLLGLHLLEVPHGHQSWPKSTWWRAHQERWLAMPQQILGDLPVRRLQSIPSMHHIQADGAFHAKFMCSRDQTRLAVELHDVVLWWTGQLQLVQGHIHAHSVYLRFLLFIFYMSPTGLLVQPLSLASVLLDCHLCSGHWARCLLLVDRHGRITSPWSFHLAWCWAKLETTPDVSPGGPVQIDVAVLKTFWHQTDFRKVLKMSTETALHWSAGKHEAKVWGHQVWSQK